MAVKNVTDLDAITAISDDANVMVVNESALKVIALDLMIEAVTEKVGSVAMYVETYDTQGLATDVYTYAKEKIAELKDSLLETYDPNGKSTDIFAYIDDAIDNFTAFDIKIVTELPDTGADYTFYLIAGDNGYKKYWYIDGAWDEIGGASTYVVTELPETGDESADYILSSDAGYIYYKYIDGVWCMIAGSMSSVLDELPEEGNELTDYYIPGSSDGVYLHYRWVNSAWVQIGSDAYSKTEVDEMISVLEESVSSASSAASSALSAATAAKDEIDALSTMVNDVVLSSDKSTITVYYSDGTTKDLDISSTDVTVVDVYASTNVSGITVEYSDGSTADIELSGGSGSSTSGAATIARITDASVQCVYGSTFNLEFTFTAVDSSGDTVGDGTATLYVNSIQKASGITVSQGDNSIDISDYLSVGSNTVKISISVDTGGDTNTTVTKTWTVNAINMYLLWDYDDTTINTGDTFTLYWTPYGDAEKTTHIIIDDVEAATSVTTRSGVRQSLTLDSLSHGAHMVEMYCTATVSSTEIQSESVYHDMIFVDEDDTTPIIAVSLSTDTMTQYNTLQIPVVIYTPGSSTSDAVLAVDGEDVAEWTSIDRTVHYWNYTPSTSGEKTLTITSGVTVKTITLTVEALDIDNEEITGYAYRLKASDLASNEALIAYTNNSIALEFSDNFDWNNGGIQTEEDDDGNTRQYICVKAGTTMTIDYALFGGDDPRTAGRSFKCIFKVVNSRDYDAVWLSCVDSSTNIGLTMEANEGTVRSLENTCSVPYAEDRYIEFEFDIRAKSVQPYIQTFLDGVLTSTTLYSDSDDFNHTDEQYITIGSDDCDVYIYMVKVYESYLSLDNHIENFIADAPNATEMVSRYNRNDVLNESGEISYTKLASQCPDLRIHLWDIPRMSTNKIKKDPVEGCSYKQIWHSGDSEYTYHQISAEGVTIGIQGTSSLNYLSSAGNTDGKFSTCSSWIDGNGNDLMDTGYSMTDGAMPVNYFNTKVNVASCENANNMCLAEWYNTYQPYKTLYAEKIEEEGVYTPRDTMELHMGVQFISDQSGSLFDYDGDYHMYAICNMGNSKNNIEVFHDITNLEECCVEVLDNNSNYCMMTDDSFDLDVLQSEDYFEFRYSADDADSDTYTDDELTAAKSAQEEAFLRFYNWMCESNPAAATDEALDESVTYGSYTFTGCGRGEDVLAGLTISEYAGTYTTDSYEYRMAKMLSECEDYLIMDAVVYHYVFIEEHTMVDNVCKNTFWSTEDLLHWQLCKNYDNDTADGINNTGVLALTYGYEGMDTLNDGYVFNGKDAVWWVFVNGLYDARQLMWQNRENAGAWDYEAYLDYVEEQQSLIPERVWNQDYWYKYLRLYEESSDSTYFSMLDGGKKTHQRASFVENNMYYMAGQYMGNACTSQSITLRGYTPSEWSGVEPASQVQVALYTKGYIVVQVGNVYKQQKADKGTLYTIEFTDSGDMNDTVINIHGANLVQKIGDISCLYVGRCDFSAATRLRSLQIGSAEDGYSNGNLSSVSFGTNGMLEELYIQNCPNVEQSLDLSGCQALVILDIRGSGFTGVIFATGGLVEQAYLCAVKTLTMRSLYNLTDDYFSLESYDSLTGLRLEDCSGIDSLTLVETAGNLARVRILGISWTLSSTDVLNALLDLAGYDESSTNISQSVLGGTATVTGDIRQSEIDSYEEAWEDLEVLYSSSNLITNYLATYVNDDGTVLYTCYVDQEETPPDPVELGYIDTPTKETDAQYIYTYSGWDNITDPMRSARTITAQYDTTVRTYTVNWYSLEGDSVALETQEDVEYGAEVIYSGDTPTRSVSNGIYSLFAGWNNSTGFITGDTDVYAVWDRASIPESGTDISDMSFAQINAICKGYEADDYFEDKDYFDITIGHDFDFDNVESEELISEATFFDGETAMDTDIQLFGDDAPDFTMVIDFEFMTQDDTSATLVSGGFVEDGSEGFRLRYSGTTESGYPNLQWGNKNTNCAYGCNRSIVVLRHIAGENNLWVYCFNLSSSTYDDAITTYELVRTSATSSDECLTFGAVKVSAEDAYSYYAKGWIYWAKIWYADLGDAVAQELCAWPRETLRMEFIGDSVYYLEGSSINKAGGSWYANNQMSLGHVMNSSATNEGGWDESEMRTFVGDRMLKALPYNVQSALLSVKIKASEGGGSTAITTSIDKVYLPSCAEMGGNTTTEPYASEGSQISFYTSNASRIKIPGQIREDDIQVITSDTEPTLLTAYKGLLSDGDIWINTSNSSYGYMYVSADTLAKHSRIGRRNISDSSNIEANDGGLWLYTYTYWERSPYASNSTYFMNVNNHGNPSGSNTASNTNGVLPGFSI